MPFAAFNAVRCLDQDAGKPDSSSCLKIETLDLFNELESEMTPVDKKRVFAVFQAKNLKNGI